MEALQVYFKMTPCRNLLYSRWNGRWSRCDKPMAVLEKFQGLIQVFVQSCVDHMDDEELRAETSRTQRRLWQEFKSCEEISIYAKGKTKQQKNLATISIHEFLQQQ